MRQDRIDPSVKGPVIKNSGPKRKVATKRPQVIVGRHPKDPIPYSQAVQKQIQYFIQKYNLRCSIMQFEICASWRDLSREEFLSDAFRDAFADLLHWPTMCLAQTLSEECMEKHEKKLNWGAVSRRQNLSKPFILRHQKQLDIDVLVDRGLITKEELAEMIDDDSVGSRFELMDFD